MTTTAASSFQWFLLACLLIKVRELIRTQQHFATLSNSFMTSLVTFVHSCLHRTCFYSSIKATFLFNSQEKFPSLFSNGHSQIFNIVRTGSRVDHFVEVRLLFQQQLLITCQTFGEFIRNSIRLVKRNNRHGIHPREGSAHSLSLRT